MFQLLIVIGAKADFDEDESQGDGVVEWVCCDSCNIWYHAPCAATKWPENIITKRKKWYCCK